MISKIQTEIMDVKFKHALKSKSDQFSELSSERIFKFWHILPQGKFS
jgi:hypothetical protein